MLSEEKIRVMSRMSMYERGRGKQDLRKDAWFKGDYLSRELLISFLAGTAAFVILVGCFLLGDIESLESLMLQLFSMDVMSLLRRILLEYIVFMLVFEAITWIVYSVRYDRAQEGLRRYYKDLKRISEGYGGKDSAGK